MARKRKTHQEYVYELSVRAPDIEVIDSYVNNSTKILHRCKIDGFEWHVAPSTVLSGHGCPMCKGNVKKTHEQYVQELSKKTSSIQVIGKYINAHTKILHKCLVDGNEWYLSPANALRGKGCPVCGGTATKTHEQYIDELQKNNLNVIPLEPYVNNAAKILHRCLVHNYDWKVTPKDILLGCGCPECKKEKLRNKFSINHDEYVERLSLTTKDIVVVERYVNARTPIQHKCNACGWKWNVAPDALLHGHGCPQCNTCSKSKGEQVIANFLSHHGIRYEAQKTFNGCKDKYVLRFDFYLPEYNILIEYNGVRHYKPVAYFGGEEGFIDTIRRDKIKKDYCNVNNITLFNIPYSANIYDELDILLSVIEEVVA